VPETLRLGENQKSYLAISRCCSRRLRHELRRRPQSGALPGDDPAGAAASSELLVQYSWPLPALNADSPSELAVPWWFRPKKEVNPPWPDAGRDLE